MVVELFEIVVRPNHAVLGVRSCVRPIGRTQRKRSRNKYCTSKNAQVASHVCYFLEEPGGNFLNILSTPLSSSFIFVLELFDKVSLAEPRQINCFVASKMSTNEIVEGQRLALNWTPAVFTPYVRASRGVRDSRYHPE